MIAVLEASQTRIETLNRMKNEVIKGEEDKNIIREEVETYEEEITNEYECQLKTAGVMSALMKIYPKYINPLINELRSKILPLSFASDDP
jgi:hypothetical protein